MIGDLINRIVPLAAITLAVCVHFHYCEWEYTSELHGVSSEQFQRAIYFSHQEHENVFLLAKDLSQKELATHYGVFLPMGLIAVSLGSMKLSDII